MKAPDQRSKRLLEAALKYAGAGYPVLPVHSVSEAGICRCSHGSNCQSPGKHPATKNGVLDATTDEGKICQFWQSNPLANVAIATGPEFGIVLDIDPRHCGDISIQAFEAKNGALPKTTTAITGGGGLHFAFKDPGGLLKNRPVMKGVDIRAKGGYVVVAPSVHASGSEYRWAEGLAPGEMPMADFPPALLDILTAKTDNTSGNTNSAVEVFPEGERNNGLAAIAGKMVRAGLDPASLFDVLSIVNQRRCRPPLDDKEVASIARSISNYGAAPIDWAPPSTLPSLEPEVPALERSILPSVIADWAWDLSERMQCPPEFAVIPVLTVLSSLIGGRTAIRPKKRDGWSEAPNLWGIVVAPPGSMKSPCLTEALRGINSLQSEAMKKYRAEKIAFDAEKEAYEVRAKKMKVDLADDGSLAEKLEKEQAELLSKKPKAKRFTVNDSTTEKLGEILSENKTGILLFRDELFGFFMSLEKKGHEADRALYLESWGGQSSYTFDRIARGTVHIERLCVSILGGIQPDRLKYYFDQALRSGSSDDGLLARFQLAVWPNVPKDFEYIDREPDSKLQETLDKVFREIAAISENGDIDTLVFQFDAEAQRVFDQWYEALQKRLRSGAFKSPAFHAHLSKFGSLMPSLALIFLITDVFSGVGSGDEITLRHAEMAIAMCDYLEAHAKKIYAATIHPELAAAHALSKKVASGELFDGMAVRDIYRKQWRALDSSDLVRQGLVVLERHKWLRIVELQPAGGQGGAPSEVIRVNPAARTLAKESGVDV